MTEREAADMSQPEESAEKAPQTDDVVMRPDGDIDRRRDEEPSPPPGERTEMQAAMDDARAERDRRERDQSS